MDIEKIKRLMELMDEHQLKRLVVRDPAEGEIELEKKGDPAVHGGDLRQHVTTTPEIASAPSSPPDPARATSDCASGLVYITSPMVGTVYLAPAPDTPDFVQVGETISDESVVCIVEAMKVMNEVKARVGSGRIVNILVKNGQPVDFGTELFAVEPEAL